MKKVETTVIYVLAIVSFLCCCFSGLGVLLAAPAFIIANNKAKDVAQNTNEYEEGSLQSIKTAKIVALIALILNIITILWTIYSIYSIGGWDAYMEKVQQMMEQYQ